MSEAGMRLRVVSALRPLDAISVENRVGPGTPDVNFIGGWIELKWLRAWPKRAKTPVRLDHDLQREQRVWLRRRRKRGGRAWVMLQCRHEWLLFDGLVAAKEIGKATREELYQVAHRVWRGLDAAKLIKALTDEAEV